MMNEKTDSNKNLAYKIGQAMACVVCMCATAILVALTVKFIMWIL